MLKYVIGLLGLFWTATAKANPAACTAVCPFIVGGGLAIAKSLGVKDEVVGVLFGALLAIFGYWMIRFCEKRGWNFIGRNLFLMALSLSTVGFVYAKTLTYKPMLHWHLLYIDSFLLATLCGAAAHICGVHLYAWLKKNNGGHAHFPFEKVVIPVLLDILVCWVFWGTELCACKEIMIL